MRILQPFFGLRRRLGRRAPPAGSDWHDRDAFLAILKRERNRSSRTGEPLSYVLIDVHNRDRIGRPPADDEVDTFITGLMNFLSGHTRDFDVRFYDGHRKLGILLIATDIAGAKSFVEKVSQLVHDHFATDGHADAMTLIDSIRISSYPMSHMPDCEVVKGSPVVVRNVSFDTFGVNGNGNVAGAGGRNGSDARAVGGDGVVTRRVLHESSRLIWNWQVVPMANGALALSAPIFREIPLAERRFRRYRFLKRVMDLVGAAVLIVVLSPFWIAAALAVRLSSPGPVIYRQKRLGQFGRPFTFFKFRTMYADADDRIHREYVKRLVTDRDGSANLGTKEKPLFKLDKDPRITPVGAILRRTSLDELPQFFNVLRGDMSLVGPRPPIKYETESYKSWHQRRILDAKPGITGLWQVYGRSKTSFDDMVRLDLQYAETHSLWLDIKLLLRTPLVIFNDEGAR